MFPLGKMLAPIPYTIAPMGPTPIMKKPNVKASNVVTDRAKPLVDRTNNAFWLMDRTYGSGIMQDFWI
jgi:hypothetical protein